MPEVSLTRSHQLGLELKELTRDDGARLAAILAELRVVVATEPMNLVALSALSHAVVLAGLVDEIRPLAWRGFDVLHRLEVVGADAILNVGAALCEGNYVREAKLCYERMLTIDPSFRDFTNMEHLAVRYGELEWLGLLLPENKVLAYLDEHGLRAGWATQQESIEHVLAGRIASVDSALEDFRDGTWRLAVTYYTNAARAERGPLYDAVWDAVDLLRGPGALLGKVIIDVEGPEIPLP